jgi:DNA-directed RNA polymerase specialized sigma24 family protein
MIWLADVNDPEAAWPCLTWDNATVKVEEVLTAYSHTSDLLDDLQKAVEIVRRHGPDDPDDGHNEDASRPSLRTLADRLSPQNAQTITDLYHGGTSTKDLAAKFGISARSVRRLIKKHSAGLSDRQDTVG